MSRNLDNLDFLESLQNFYGLTKAPNETYKTFLDKLIGAWDTCKISEDVTLRERIICNITDQALKDQISEVGNISSRKIMALCRSFDEVGLQCIKDNEKKSCFEISEVALSYMKPELVASLKNMIEVNQEFLGNFTRNSDKMVENLLTNCKIIDDWRKIIVSDVKEAFKNKYPNDITVLSLGTNIYGSNESLDVHLELVDILDMQRCLLIFGQCKKFQIIKKVDLTIFVVHIKSGITCNIPFERTQGAVKANIHGMIKFYSRNEEYQKFVNILLLWFEKCLGKENSNFSVFKMVWRFIEDHQIGNNFQYKRHLVPFFQYIIYIINFPEKLAFDCVRFEEFICVKDDHFLVCNVKPLRMFLEKSTVLMEYIY